jgi:hypothetical protein
MNPPVQQDRYNPAYRLNCISDVGRILSFAPIMETDDVAPACVAKNTALNRSARERPIPAQNRPHYAEKIEFPLCLAKPEPSNAVGRAKQDRRYVNGLANRFLRGPQLLENEFWRAEGKKRVRRGMISDLVPGRVNRPGNLRMTPDLDATLKERRLHAISRQNIEEM